MAITTAIIIVTVFMNVRLNEARGKNQNSTLTSDASARLENTLFQDEPYENATKTENRRMARQLNADRQEYVVKGGTKTKRQIIKIPANVSKVKVMAQPPPPNVRYPNPNRLRQPAFKPRYVPNTRNGPPRRLNNKRPELEFEYDYDNEESEYYPPKKPKRSYKKPKVYVKDVSPQEFYDDSEEYEQLGSANVNHYKKPKKPIHSVQKSHKKHKNRHISKHKPEEDEIESIESDYDVKPYPSKKPAFEEDSGYEIVKPGRPRERPEHHSYSEPDYEPYGYEQDYAGSSIHMKQVPAPNLSGLKVVEPPDMIKESHSVKKSKPEMHKNDHENHVEYKFKKNPSRQMQSMFPQQYTSHNPHVTTNFGLTDGEGHRATVSPYSYRNEQHYADFEFGKFNQPVGSASEHQATSVPVGSSGIHVVQPPNFGGDYNVPTTPSYAPQPTNSNSNQRATIRDILQQDCPESEFTGYCASPPRYPTQQINNIVKKCSDLMDVMASPFPPEPEDDLSSFSRKSDQDLDIIIEDDILTNNNTFASADAPVSDMWSSWSRSSTESGTACSSDFSVIEPGYAKEVLTGRWFVIVQTQDSAIQKITIDSCSRPGKSCGGLVGIKCSRISGLKNGIKSTRCIQRFTHHRLISWDPESPSKCPRIRVFKFPTACICHLGLI